MSPRDGLNVVFRHFNEAQSALISYGAVFGYRYEKDNYTLHPLIQFSIILLYRSLRDRRIIYHCGEKGGFSWGNLKKRDHLEDLGVDGRIIIRLGGRGMD